MPEPLVPKSKHVALEQRVTNIEQSPGGSGGGYSEILKLGRPYPPSPADDVIDAIGFEFTASVDATVNAVRLWTRLPDDAANRQVEANVRLIVNDDDRSNIPITVHKGEFAEATAFLVEPVTITAGDRVGVVIQNYNPGRTPQLLGTYTEAGDDYYGVGYQALSGWFTNVSVGEPLSYTRVAHADTGDTYPAAQLLSTVGAPELLPHALFRRTFGSAQGAQGDGWWLRDGRANLGTLPAVLVQYDGQLYQSQLWPVNPSPATNDPFGAYIPKVGNVSKLGPRSLAWVNGQLLAVSPDGSVYQIPVTPIE